MIKKINYFLFLIILLLIKNNFAQQNDTVKMRFDGVPDREYLVTIDNHTEENYYKIILPKLSPESDTLLAPKSKLEMGELILLEQAPIIIACVKGGGKSIYIQRGHGFASGQCEGASSSMHYIEYWTTYPSAPEYQKSFVRFCSQDKSYLGVIIHENEEVEIIGIEGTKIFKESN